MQPLIQPVWRGLLFPVSSENPFVQGSLRAVFRQKLFDGCEQFETTLGVLVSVSFTKTLTPSTAPTVRPRTSDGRSRDRAEPESPALLLRPASPCRTGAVPAASPRAARTAACPRSPSRSDSPSQTRPKSRPRRRFRKLATFGGRTLRKIPRSTNRTNGRLSLSAAHPSRSVSPSGRDVRIRTSRSLLQGRTLVANEEGRPGTGLLADPCEREMTVLLDVVGGDVGLVASFNLDPIGHRIPRRNFRHQLMGVRNQTPVA